jgi:serine/threonine protein kinase
MEYSGKSLDNLCNELSNLYQRMNSYTIMSVLNEIEKILDYLDRLDLIYVDIKLDNFLYQYNSEENKYDVYLIDYSSIYQKGSRSYHSTTFPRFDTIDIINRKVSKKDHDFGLFVTGFLLYHNDTFTKKILISYTSIYKLLVHNRIKYNTWIW